MRTGVNYGIVHVRLLDRDLQYHARWVSQEKSAEAVKRMIEGVHCRESRELTPHRVVIRPFNSVRICLTGMCRRGTAAITQRLLRQKVFFNLSQASRAS